jgi:hypothetical protein
MFHDKLQQIQDQLPKEQKDTAVDSMQNNKYHNLQKKEKFSSFARRKVLGFLNTYARITKI